MKTLFGVVRALKGRIKKSELRKPKRFWRVEFANAEFVWSAYMSEQPSFKVMHEVWRRESVVAGSWLAAHDGPGADADVVAPWKQQRDVAEALMQIFAGYRSRGKIIVVQHHNSQTDIKINEEVLN
jgi:hypothetical protein